MKLFKWILFFTISICFGQEIDEMDADLNEDKNNKEIYTSHGISFNVGDTLTFGDADRYISILKGRGLSVKYIENSMKDTKCVITKFKKMYGYDYTFCKDFENQIYMLTLDNAISLNEIELTDNQRVEVQKIMNPPRDIPEDFIPFNFQGISWNSSIVDINTVFPNSKKINELMIGDKATINGIDTDLTFLFNKNNNLDMIMYRFNSKHSNDNLFIEDFLEIKSLLIKKYGEPKIDTKNWRDDLYKDDYQKFGFAISIGDLEYYTKWELPDTDIILKLYGDNYKISHILGYRKFPKEEISVNKKESLNKL